MAIDGHPQQSTAGTASTAVLATIGHDAEDTDRPDWRDPVSVAHQDLWMRCREAYEGTDALLANARRYLPKHKKEKAEDYNARVAHSAAFNAYGITITGLLGLAFAKEPTLGADVPRQLKAHAENIDGRGTPLALFARNLAEEGMVVGSTGFMVLYPPRPADATARDEHEGVLRPYWAPILIEDVYSWDYQTVGAREVMMSTVTSWSRRVSFARYLTRPVRPSSSARTNRKRRPMVSPACTITSRFSTSPSSYAAQPPRHGPRDGGRLPDAQELTCDRINRKHGNADERGHACACEDG